MDIRNSGLIVGLYVVLGLAVAGVAGWSWYLMGRQGQVEELLRAEATEERPSGLNGTSLNDAFLHQRQEAFAEAAQRIKQLEGLLQRKTDLLNRRTELLHQRSVEYDALRQEADRYLMLLVEQLAAPAADGADSKRPDAAELDEEKREAMQSELERMRLALQESEMLEAALELELEQVRQELQSAQNRLTESEIRDLVGDGGPPRRPIATEALVRVGDEAVAILMVSLRDERPDIRLWAAEVLAEMGPVARAAVPLLNTARTDTDPAVRQAAVRALASINAIEP